MADVDDEGITNMARTNRCSGNAERISERLASSDQFAFPEPESNCEVAALA
jgi:hypothetical protein